MMIDTTYAHNLAKAGWTVVSAHVDLPSMASGAFIRPNHEPGSGVI